MILHWRAAGVSLALDCSGPLLPRVLHWGADLGDGPAEQLAALATAAGAMLSELRKVAEALKPLRA